MPRMRWRPGLCTGPRYDAPPDPLVGWGGGHPSLESHASRRLDPHAFSIQHSLLDARFLAYTQLNFGNTPLIASIVISLSRGCLPNDEGPGPPPNIFRRTATGDNGLKSLFRTM